MADTNNTKPAVTPPAPPKSFMTAGPTLHYSHTNVLWFWGLAFVVYVLACGFWNSLSIDNNAMLDLTRLVSLDAIKLGQFVVYPISIYEYPWQIIVLGTVMGIITVVPLLVSQLLSFRYSLLMVMVVVFIAKLHLFGAFLFFSCIAVACRPLRFRSRFISVALCMAPQLVYWALWGGQTAVDPVKWGLSFAPWIYAWLTSLLAAGIVLGVGHFTRYKPGLVFVVSGILLAGGFVIFQKQIGFAERDYQGNVAGNNPEDVREFQDHDLSGHISAVIEDPSMKSFLIGKFFPIEPILLREKLKEEIQRLIIYDQWPEWFSRKMPEELKYQAKRRWLINQYNQFMEKWPDSDRVAVALYFKAILSEYHPDTRHFGKTESLRFYSDYPFYDNLLLWQTLQEKFPQSPESFEALWRIAMHEAGKAEFDKADEKCQVALSKIRDYLAERKENENGAAKADSLFTAFHDPALTVMTPFKLRDLEIRVKRLQRLIDKENRGADEAAKRRLSTFVILNPYAMEYPARLDSLLAEMEKDDALRDNVMLEKTMLIEDARQRMQKLAELTQAFPTADGGVRALYELAMVKVQLWKDEQTSEETRPALLAEARTILNDFVNAYPDSLFAEQAQTMLQSLPKE